jgi:hypothetical protein
MSYFEKMSRLAIVYAVELSAPQAKELRFA